MKYCPRCHRKCLEEEDVLNATSHIGDNLKICSMCGLEQGCIGVFNTTDIVEFEMEKRFKKELKL